MTELQRAVEDCRRAGEAVQNTATTLLTLERVGAKSVAVVHTALSNLGEALQEATKAQRALAGVLALDPDKLAADEPLVAPLIEGVLALEPDDA